MSNQKSTWVCGVIALCVACLHPSVAAAQQPEFNPCQVSDRALFTNPDAVYVLNEAFGDPTWADRATLTVHQELTPPTDTAPATVKSEPEETMTVTMTAANATPYPNCYKISYTPGLQLTRDGQTVYYVRTRASHSGGLRGPEGPLSNPFVLTQPNQRQIPVTVTRVGSGRL